MARALSVHRCTQLLKTEFWPVPPTFHVFDHFRPMEGVVLNIALAFFAGLKSPLIPVSGISQHSLEVKIPDLVRSPLNLLEALLSIFSGFRIGPLVHVADVAAAVHEPLTAFMPDGVEGIEGHAQGLMFGCSLGLHG